MGIKKWEQKLKILATIGWLRYEDQDGSENGAKFSVAGRVVPEF